MTQLTPIRQGHVTHPLVGQVFLKKGFDALDHKKPRDVLVIETQFPVEAEDGQDFSTCLSALLSDLPELEKQAEAKIGRFDRVDIRYAH